MMKYVVLGVILYGLAAARPQTNEGTTPIPIVNQYTNNSPDGSFNTTYETGNGIRVENAGYLKRIKVPQHTDEAGNVVQEHDEDIIVQVGSFSYPDTNGNLISLSYIADENGFQPTGDHLPKAPVADQSEPFARAVGQGQGQGQQQQSQFFQQQQQQQPTQQPLRF